LSVWWLKLKSYRANARAYCEARQRAGVKITFKGARHIYRQARNGVVYANVETLVPCGHENK